MPYLPDLPGTDEKTLKQNRVNPFYKKRPADFWHDAHIEHVELKERSSCDHFFMEREDDYLCKKCKIGFTKAGLKIKDGHLYEGDLKIM